MFFKAFLLPNANWNNVANENYGQVDDVNGTVVNRNAADKVEDLDGFNVFVIFTDLSL